jgi:tetratricopeptide (TPR) repeat protein
MTQPRPGQGDRVSGSAVASDGPDRARFAFLQEGTRLADLMRRHLLFALVLLFVPGCSPAEMPAAASAASRPAAWRALRADAARRDEAGEYRGAVERILESLVEAEPSLAARPAELADLLEQVGDYQRDFQAWSAAETAYLRALELRRRQHGSPSRQVAMIHNELGQLYADEGRAAEAEAQLLAARDMLSRLPSPDRGDLALVQHNLGGAYSMQDRDADARDLWEQALATRTALFGERSSATATTLFNLAALTEFEERPEEAEKLYRRALAGYSADAGEDHPDTAITGYMLADLLLELDRAGEALPLLQHAVPVYERAYGGDHPALLEPLTALHQALSALGRGADAKALEPRLQALATRQLFRMLPDHGQAVEQPVPEARPPGSAAAPAPGG